jgi:hypothetical protein
VIGEKVARGLFTSLKGPLILEEIVFVDLDQRRRSETEQQRTLSQKNNEELKLGIFQEPS